MPLFETGGQGLGPDVPRCLLAHNRCSEKQRVIERKFKHSSLLAVSQLYVNTRKVKGVVNKTTIFFSQLDYIESSMKPKTILRKNIREIREEERQLAADEAIARIARKETLIKDRQHFRTISANSMKAGDLPVTASLKPLPEKRRKEQEQKSKDGKTRILSKSELTTRPFAIYPNRSR